MKGHYLVMTCRRDVLLAGLLAGITAGRATCVSLPPTYNNDVLLFIPFQVLEGWRHQKPIVQVRNFVFLLPFHQLKRVESKVSASFLLENEEERKQTNEPLHSLFMCLVLKRIRFV